MSFRVRFSLDSVQRHLIIRVVQKTKLGLLCAAASFLTLAGIQSASASQACSDASGIWFDPLGQEWDLGQAPNGTISGGFGLHAGGTCTNGQQYTITSGWYVGNGTFVVTATQTALAAGGSAVAGCPSTIGANMTMKQPGCDHGSALVTGASAQM